MLSHVARIAGSGGPSAPLSGYIMLAYACRITHRYGADPTATTEPTWQEKFGNMIDYWGDPPPTAWSYSNLGSTADTGSVVYPEFYPNRTYNLQGSCAYWSPDQSTCYIEFLDANDNVIAAIRWYKTSSYTLSMYYGPNLSSLTAAGRYGSYARVSGELTFTDTAMVFTNTRTSSYNKSFTFACDVASIAKIRVDGYAYSSYTSASGGVAYGWCELLPEAA